MLQAFWIFIKSRGHTSLECGPDWPMQKRRAQVSARLGSQRAPGDSRLGLDHLLPPGLGRELHMQQAKQQKNPFGNDLPLDTDILFAAEAMVRWGAHIGTWRRYQHMALKGSFRPWLLCALLRMPCEVLLR